MRGWGLRARIAAVVGVLLLALSATGAAIRGSDEGAAYASGSAFGRVLGALALALLIRWGYVRLFAREKKVRAWPWLLLTAGVLAIPLELATVSRERDEVEEAVRECREKAGTPFVPPTGSLRYEDLPEAEERLLRDSLPSSYRGAVEGQVVMDGATAAAIVVAVAIGEDAGEREDFENGFAEEAAEYEIRLSNDRVAGERVVVGKIQGRTVILGFYRCYGTLVIADTFPRAAEIAELVLAE